jgi:hypothetical protein
MISRFKTTAGKTQGRNLGSPSADGERENPPDTQTEDSSSSNTNKRTTALNATKSALEILEKILQDVPVPGLRASISGLLSIMDTAEVSIWMVILTCQRSFANETFTI